MMVYFELPKGNSIPFSNKRNICVFNQCYGQYDFHCFINVIGKERKGVYGHLY